MVVRFQYADTIGASFNSIAAASASTPMTWRRCSFNGVAHGFEDLKVPIARPCWRVVVCWGAYCRKDDK